MMQNNPLDLQAAAETYAPVLLRWAYRKCAAPAEAEELVQNVWAEFFTAVRQNETRGIPIADPERLLWKIAHYVWCHHVRCQTTQRRYHTPLPDDADPALALADDGQDFTAALAESEETQQRIAALRQTVSHLAYLQREILVSYYIDGRSQRDIADRLGISAANVKWHLYDTRRKLKEALTTMEHTQQNNTYLSRPKTLHQGGSGMMNIPHPDIRYINNSLTKQNICIACYRSPKTCTALAEMLGIPAAYLEDDLRWLTEREFVEETPKGFSTMFSIQTAKDENDIHAVYAAHKTHVADTIIDGLCAAKETLHSIGFHGCSRPMEQLLWLLIYSFCGTVRAQFPEHPPIRPDGGRYFPLGFDHSEPLDAETRVLPPWDYNGCMHNDNFWWFGLYHFGKAEIEDLMDGMTDAWRQLHDALCYLLHAEGDTAVLSQHYDTETARFVLAQLTEKGFVTLSPDMKTALPGFCVFTAAQYRRLQEEIFAPIADRLRPALAALQSELSALCTDKLPPQLKHLEPQLLHMAMADLGFTTTAFAALDGRLYLPTADDPQAGAFLTLKYVFRK